MPSSLIRQRLATGLWVPDEGHSIARAAPWLFALLLLGLAGTLILAGSAFPDFFGGSFNNFVSDTP
jgi:hypothetical protein